MLLVAATVGLQFYLSRKHRKFTTSIMLFCVVANVLLLANFYFNSGVQGPTLFIFLLSIFLTIAIVPKKQYLYWIGLNLATVIGLLLYSYLKPDAIAYSYVSEMARYLDLGYSYIFVALVIFMVTAYIRNGYDDEKATSDQKAAELQTSNDTKNKLLSILAHDLRSPLASIQNYLELLSEFDMSEEEKKTISSILLAETQNTQQMLSNLLSWTKSQMEGTQVNFAKINLRETLAPVLKSQHSVASGKMIDLQNTISADVYLLADKDMLQLVIRNLLNNAIKFTPAGGFVTISSKKDGSECVIMVTDSGSGIPEDKQDNLFSLRAQSTFGTQNEKGVGLGLALCKEFTEFQNGRIWFESKPGSPTTFFVSLQRYTDAETPAASAAHQTENKPTSLY
jgi:two-component system sensor histidine kinase/response regulator